MIFFFKQKTAYEMRIIDWSSDVCSSDLKEMRTEAIRRVRGYKDPLFVETRADARILEAELQLREVQAKRLAARTLLASFWGGIAEGLVISEGIEKPDPRDPPLAEADTAVFDAAVDRARARVVVEQSRAVQDYTVAGGTRFLRETNRTEEDTAELQ